MGASRSYIYLPQRCTRIYPDPVVEWAAVFFLLPQAACPCPCPAHFSRKVISGNVDGGDQAKQHVHRDSHACQHEGELDGVEEVWVHEALNKHANALVESLRMGRGGLLLLFKATSETHRPSSGRGRLDRAFPVCISQQDAAHAPRTSRGQHMQEHGEHLEAKEKQSDVFMHNHAMETVVTGHKHLVHWVCSSRLVA